LLVALCEDAYPSPNHRWPAISTPRCHASKNEGSS
jgi:hypothetical protein